MIKRKAKTVVAPSRLPRPVSDDMQLLLPNIGSHSITHASLGTCEVDIYSLSLVCTWSYDLYTIWVIMCVSDDND